MKPVILIALLFLIASCKRLSSSDEKYFEDVTGIKMPSDYHLIEHYDNAEFITGATVGVNHAILTSFIKRNNFKSTTNNF